MSKELEGEWCLVDGQAVFWDGTKYRRFKWKGDPGLYEFQDVWYLWNGSDWKKATAHQLSQINSEKRARKSTWGVGLVFRFLKSATAIVLAVFVLGYFWNFLADAPSTRGVCYVFSKATDLSIPEEDSIEASQWWSENIKTLKDLENVDPQVLSALNLYGETGFLDEELPEGSRIRDFVISTCEEIEAGSTEH